MFLVLVVPSHVGSLSSLVKCVVLFMKDQRRKWCCSKSVHLYSMYGCFFRCSSQLTSRRTDLTQFRARMTVSLGQVQ